MEFHGILEIIAEFYRIIDRLKIAIISPFKKVPQGSVPKVYLILLESV
jgi:hypothetical protein